ncbi:MAG: DUF4232 domain-containing protein [Actinomycetota bacterium]|nr:DUF4232 domain-containing protein [Actinomycetota bacterium]
MSRLLFIAGIVFMALIVSLMIRASLFGSASSQPRTCSYGQLDVVTASPSGAYDAAGNHGIPFYVVNIGHSACHLVGYPHITFSPQSFGGKTLRVSHGGGGIFAAVAPRLVTLSPGATASFAIDFSNASNQQDPSGTACTTRTANVLLPVLASRYGSLYRPNVSFNFCFTGFLVAVTPIERGPIPKLG